MGFERLLSNFSSLFSNRLFLVYQKRCDYMFFPWEPIWEEQRKGTSPMVAPFLVRPAIVCFSTAHHRHDAEEHRPITDCYSAGDTLTTAVLINHCRDAAASEIPRKFPTPRPTVHDGRFNSANRCNFLIPRFVVVRQPKTSASALEISRPLPFRSFRSLRYHHLHMVKYGSSERLETPLVRPPLTALDQRGCASLTGIVGGVWIDKVKTQAATFTNLEDSIKPCPQNFSSQYFCWTIVFIREMRKKGATSTASFSFNATFLF